MLKIRPKQADAMAASAFVDHSPRAATRTTITGPSMTMSRVGREGSRSRAK